MLPEFLPPELRGAPPPAPSAQAGTSAGPDLMKLIDDLLARGEKDLYPKVMQVVERALLTRVLQETHGHQGHASERLGLNRSTLRYKLRDLGLSVERVVGGPGEDSAEPARPDGAGK